MIPYPSLVRATMVALVCAAGLACQVSEKSQAAIQADLVISGATLIDGTGAAPRTAMTIVVSDGRIAGVMPDSEAKTFAATTVIDAVGKYVIPGLADMHVHFSLGVPIARQPETTDKVLARQLYYGVTSILMLGGTDGSSDSIRDLRDRRAADTLQAPYIYGTGGHLTLQGTHPIYTIFPPTVRKAADALAEATPQDDPVNLYSLGIGLSIVRTEEAAREAVRERAEGGMHAIKITVESGPTPFGDDHPQMSVEMIRAIVDEAARHDLRVFAHVTSRDELEAVLAGGAAGVVHTVEGSPLPDTALADQMAAAGFIVVPTLSIYSGLVSLWYVDEPFDPSDPFLRETVSDEELAALRDPEFLARFRRGGSVTVAPGIGREEANRRRMAELLANVGMLHERGVPMALGTDTGNPYVFPGYSVHRELELLVQAGLTPQEALEVGTRRAAELLGAEKEFGTIETGKRADLLVLRANPLENIRNTRSLEVVVSEGRLVNRDALLSNTR